MLVEKKTINKIHKRFKIHEKSNHPAKTTFISMVTQKEITLFSKSTNILDCLCIFLFTQSIQFYNEAAPVYTFIYI